MRGKTIVATILHIGRNVKVGSYHMQLTSGKIDVVQIKRRRAEVQEGRLQRLHQK